MNADKFWKMGKRVGDCLLWQGATTSKGYGNVILDGQQMTAHGGFHKALENRDG